ncbi:phospholipase D-like domain-containing protein [Bacteroides sp.]
MNIQFIGQGLNPANDTTTGNYVINSLVSGEYNSFRAFVAFVSMGGLRNIIDELLHFINDGGSVKLYVGVDLNGTSKEALEHLLENNIETYIVYSSNNIVFHPKIYLFESDERKRIIIGSSNLTSGGLFQNMEASICVDFDDNNDNGNTFLSNIYNHFTNIIENNHQSCQLLTRKILDVLINNKIVLPEVENRVKYNKINSEFGRKDARANKQLTDLFGKVKGKRPPKGYKKTAIKQELVIENNEVTIVDNAIELVSGTMWIETNAMTGGSKNQLDISKRGVLNGEVIEGSARYFGALDDTNRILNLNFHFGGKVYRGNTVKYTPRNSNWRIQLKGVTDDGEKLTTFSKPSHGRLGGFQFKILLFTKIDETNYKLEILDPDDMNKLIENSSVWGKMGNETTGRAYGFIS